MDAGDFDTLVRALAAGVSRRNAVAGAVAAASTAVATGAARKRRRGGDAASRDGRRDGDEAPSGGGSEEDRCIDNGKRCGKGKGLKPCKRCCSGRSVETGKRGKKRRRCACRPDGAGCTSDAQCCAGACTGGICTECYCYP